MDTQTPAPEPDMIAQVGEMIARLSAGEFTNPVIAANPDDVFDKAEDDRSILVASAILAVAAELRAVRNELAEFQRAWIVRQ